METRKDSYQSFTDLEVWKAARQFKKDMECLAKTFPPEEKFRLSDQLVRSARSINGNIAEGHGRFTYKDQLHFCIQARGSLSETLNHLIDAFDCAYISREQLSEYQAQYAHVEKLLNGYIAYLRKSI